MAKMFQLELTARRGLYQFKSRERAPVVIGMGNMEIASLHLVFERLRWLCTGAFPRGLIRSL